MSWRGLGKPDRRQALFGGAGVVSVWSFGEALPAPFEAVLGCELAPSSSVGPHVQERCAEVLLVTEGRGTCRVDGRPAPLKPGSLVALPLGATLELANRSKREALRYLIVKAVAS